ncbi:KTSC domain-containing protein [Pleionea sp. CnH1-48]|uniref:KTSC domain-containing protein n=1 Tax=Pleionea sp. CnH1-48 TaxID=2954494 RepID=UPI002096B506|nr:KTSC domain-containing protein [Pleionea sp. CnH1-48]
MIDWVYVNSKRIRRIGYNSISHAMHVDIKNSPQSGMYKGVPKSLFCDFIMSEDIDAFYQEKIESVLMNQAVRKTS